MYLVHRFLFLSKCTRLYSSILHPIKDLGSHFPRNACKQMQCIKYASEEPNTDWVKLKDIVLKIPGTVNQKNFEGVMLKTMVKSEKFDAALSYANYLRKMNDELSLGSINGLLSLYYALGQKGQLTSEDREFILELYNRLYEKHKVLDYSTSTSLLHALCVIDECQKGLKVLEDITISKTPTHSAYSTLISALFRNNKSSEAQALIQRSINDGRPLQDIAYEGWIQYIVKKYEEKKTKIKHIDEICVHIANNWATVKQDTADRIKDTYTSLGWKAQFSALEKSGKCQSCKQTLDRLDLTDEEFRLLQTNVKEKLIVGSDLFLKTSPDELKRFTNFLNRTAPYDIILDALNIAFATRQQHNAQKVNLICVVVSKLLEQNKKIMLLGRKHMLGWPKKSMQYLMSNTHSFFIDNLSQDDPYFISAAIMSGPQTYIVSKDLFRQHLFKMDDERLKILFRKWQWQHQCMLYTTKKNEVFLQKPLQFTPTAQKKNNVWHLPYEKQDASCLKTFVSDGTPDLTNWLCIQPEAS